MPASADAPRSGQEVAETECQGCHGPQGRSEDPQIPSIGGFSEFAIMDLMETYRRGLRQAATITMDDGTRRSMADVVEAMSSAEIETVAMYYAAQTWTPREQPFDAALARRGARVHAVKCGKCHLKGGSVPEADHALLAGQWRGYLEGEFRNFDSGARRMVDKMKQKYDSLSAADKLALIEYYVGAGRR